MSTAIASRSQQARLAAGFRSPDAAAIALAVPGHVYQNHEMGRTGVKPTELRRYADVFHVSHGWLATGVGLGPAG